LYINTGTWRPRLHKTYSPVSEMGYRYVTLKHMTYAVFYRKDEDPKGKAKDTFSCDVWTGFKSKRYQ
jgi:hypothetical protein